MRGGTPGAEPECQEGFNAGDVGMALALYLLWQVLYFIKTEVADKVRTGTCPEGKIAGCFKCIFYLFGRKIGSLDHTVGLFSFCEAGISSALSTYR